jgi:hypothetical protein
MSRSERIKAAWARMLPGHKEQFLERVTEAALLRFRDMTPEEKRRLTAARAKRWAGHTALHSLSATERRKRKRTGVYALVSIQRMQWSE